jgi:NitT/TauT family transport system ATP-binding protein
VNRYADRRGQSERDAADVDRLLAEVGLTDFADSRPPSLSGGMRQRVAIARGFAQGAPVMLMDEPFAALDELTRGALCRLLLRIFDAHRRTIVFVTHSASEAVMLSDRVVVMSPRPGRIAAEITINLPRPRPPDVAQSPAFSSLVGGVSGALARTSWELQ